MKKKGLVVPIVFSSPPPEFGELKEDPRFRDEHDADSDLSYVPGFSDLRRRRDREVMEVMNGRRRAKDVVTLPCNLRWARSANKAGEPDSRKVLSHARRGYRLVTKDDIGAEWLKELPYGASIGADGAIRQGDCELMVTDAQQAARNQREKERRTEQQMEGAKQALTQHPSGSIEESPGAPYIQTKE